MSENKLNEQAEKAVENSTIIVGRRVSGKWQIAVLLHGVFEKVVTEASLEKAMAEALEEVYERSYKNGDRIQFKIDVVSE